MKDVCAIVGSADSFADELGGSTAGGYHLKGLLDHKRGKRRVVMCS